MLREPPARCQEPGLAEAPWGRRVPPQEEAPGEGDGPALRAKATELGGQRLGRGRTQARVLRRRLGAAPAATLGKGLDQEARLDPVSPPAIHEQVKESGDGGGTNTPPLGLTLHLAWSSHKSCTRVHRPTEEGGASPCPPPAGRPLLSRGSMVPILSAVWASRAAFQGAGSLVLGRLQPRPGKETGDQGAAACFQITANFPAWQPTTCNAGSITYIISLIDPAR